VTEAALSTPAGVPDPSAGARLLLRRVGSDKVTVAAIAMLAVIVGSCLLAPWLAPDDPLKQNLFQVLSGPSIAHPLGTDTLGRDVLSRLMYGGRATIPAVATAMGVYCLLGVVTGLLAGYLGGWVDHGVSVVVDLLMSLPGVVILLAVSAVFTGNEYATMSTLGLVASGGLIRVVRAECRAVRQELYVTAAVVAGVSNARILARHILPRLLGPVIAQASLFAGVALGIEAGLGFLGLGVPPPRPTWGNMIGEAFSVVNRDPWLLFPSGVLLGLTTLCCALIGDGVRAAIHGKPGSLAPVRAIRRARAARGGAGAVAQGGALLRVDDLSVTSDSTGNEIIRGISFQIQRGELLGLVGESGSGKTMTALSVLGLLPGNVTISGGTVELDGVVTSQLPEGELAKVRGSRVGLISQEPMVALDPSFTVGNQLVEVIRCHQKISRAKARRRAIELLETVRLRSARDLLRKYPHELSGGMAQRVALALALSGDPDLLVADEPTTALDVSVQGEILDLLRALSETRGMAILLVTHDLGVVADVCERVLVMHDGKIIEQAGVFELFASPEHDYTRALIAATPSLLTEAI